VKEDCIEKDMFASRESKERKRVDRVRESRVIDIVVWVIGEEWR